jgi:fused signal recognition particle receptor
VFQKLREVFKKFIESASSLLIEDLKLELISRDVAYEVAENITNRLLEAVEKGIIKSKKQLMLNLREIIISYFTSINRVDLYNLAVSNRPFKVVFLGVNGVGKTTTIAKVAVYFRDHGFKPLMIAADTFRAAAQEQLKVHSERVGIPVFLGKYGVDPASVAYDGVLFGLNRGYDVFLIDTAGRMHVDVDLVNELRKIIRVVKPHFKILVVDAYEEGGVPLTLAYVLKKPILFIGTGQGYRDLKVFDYLEYVDKVIPLE